MKNNQQSIFLRCPEQLYEQLKSEALKKGFRSIQEYVLQILRERKPAEEVKETAEKVTV